MASKWLFQCNPRVWDIFAWWEDTGGAETIETWSVSRHQRDVQVGDGAVLWVSGKEAGVYGIGSVSDEPYLGTSESKYWSDPAAASAEDWYCGLDLRMRFASPIRKDALKLDPRFASALVLRIPGGGTPMRLSGPEWDTIVSRKGRQQSPPTGLVAVSERALGAAPSEGIMAPTTTPAKIEYREARLLKRYERWLGSPLVVPTLLLPSGERIVADALDKNRNLLIEAKASADRFSMRTAIGQLFDYRRFLRPRPAMAVLVPSRPSEDLCQLLRGLGIRVIHPMGQVFVEF